MSSKWYAAGDTFAIMIVLLAPPRESFKMRVSLEFLYGIYVVVWSAAAIFALDRLLLACTRALMQLPRTNKLLFMLIPSISLSPVADVFLARSDPARSIRESLLMSSCCVSMLFCSMRSCKMACDRELVAFSAVAACVRAWDALWIIWST